MNNEMRGGEGAIFHSPCLITQIKCLLRCILMRQYNAKHEWSKRDNRQLFFSCSGGRTSTESLCSLEWRDAVEEKRLILRICLIDCGV